MTVLSFGVHPPPPHLLPLLLLPWSCSLPKATTRHCPGSSSMLIKEHWLRNAASLISCKLGRNRKCMGLDRVASSPGHFKASLRLSGALGRLRHGWLCWLTPAAGAFLDIHGSPCFSPPTCCSGFIFCLQGQAERDCTQEMCVIYCTSLQEGKHQGEV